MVFGFQIARLQIMLENLVQNEWKETTKNTRGRGGACQMELFFFFFFLPPIVLF